MSDTQQQVTRRNRQGSPCPPWCATDHDMILVEAQGVRPAITFNAHCGPGHEVAGTPFAQACAVQLGDAPREVQASAGTGYVIVSPADAGQLAKFLEGLAGLEAGQLRELAAAVRLAAADGAA